MKMGVSGSGVGLRLHLPILKERSDVSVKQIWLPHIDDRRHFAKKDFECEVTTACEGIDCVVITNPPSAQLEYVRFLRGSRRLILCEKPAGLRSIDVADVEQSLGGNAADVYINYQLRFDERIQELERIVAQHTTNVHITYASNASRLGGPAWYGRSAAGGGPLWAVGSHLIDLMFAIGLGPTRARARLLCHRCHAHSLSCAFKLELMHSQGVSDLSIDTSAEYCEFSIEAESSDLSVTIDLISGAYVESRMKHPLYGLDGSRTLSSLAKRPWRSAQTRLYEVMLTDREHEFANVAAQLPDAHRVHKVLESVRANLRTGHGVWSVVGGMR